MHDYPRPDEAIGLEVERHGNDWTVILRSYRTPTVAGVGSAILGTAPELAPFLEPVVGDGPAEVLERLGQALDRREASRLTGGAPVRDEAAGVIAQVVEVLERAASSSPSTPMAMTLEQIARAAGITEADAVVALDQAQADGVVKAGRMGGQPDGLIAYWLASDDQVEDAER